jgi:hypothetical protein
MDDLDRALVEMGQLLQMHPNPWEAHPLYGVPWLYEVLMDGEAERWARQADAAYRENDIDIGFARLLFQHQPMPAHCTIAMPDPTPTRYATEMFQ